MLDGMASEDANISCRGDDPFEDTERPLLISCHVEPALAAEGTIRLRILKVICPSTSPVT